MQDSEKLVQGNVSQERALDFILAGNALITIKSNKADVRFTYKILRKKDESYEVMVFNGTDNTKDYKLIGWIFEQEGMKIFKPRDLMNKSTAFFKDIYMNLSIQYPMPQIEIWHEGRCCRCGRVLTVPESIAMGIGPECIFK